MALKIFTSILAITWATACAYMALTGVGFEFYSMPEEHFWMYQTLRYTQTIFLGAYGLWIPFYRDPLEKHSQPRQKAG